MTRIRLKPIIRCIHVFFIKRPGSNQQHLILISIVNVLLLLMLFGYMSVLAIFAYGRPFCMDAFHVGMLITTHAISVCVLTALISLFKKHTLDNTYLYPIIGLFGLVGDLVIFGLAKRTWLLYIAASIGSLFFITMPVLRSKLSRLVEPSEYAIVFIAAAFIEAGGDKGIDAASNSIYNASLHFWPGLVFLVLALLIGIEPFFGTSNRAIEKLTVHSCQATTNSYQRDTVGYDDQSHCKGDESLLVYQWALYSSLSPFQINDDAGFQLGESKVIVLTITYFEEQQSLNDQSGVILYISAVAPQFSMGSMVVGNSREGKRFSCRISNNPRLLYGIQQLFPKTTNGWWRVYFLRYRILGRNILESVLDSSINSNRNESTVEIVSSYTFLKSGDYLIIECEKNYVTNCEFLIFYKYKKTRFQYFIETDHICENNDYPKLFELLPLRKISEFDQISPSTTLSISATTIFLCIFMLLLFIWISTICGCVIMRRARGLVNLHKESAFSLVSRGVRTTQASGRAAKDPNQKYLAAADRTAQLDIEHMGLMSS
ncbi:unnamed protein product [Rotaria socialis]|uniref:Uncharacterized protein n=1 Tax=Rotaria socialis TaxID=392032 RepID=A0A820BU95_9BILA|nr:unnamed protein product [Rotaria socialis]